MYGCRLIVPYFPSLFFALLDLADTAPEPTRGRASHDPVPAKVTAVMLGLQAILGYVVYARGMNPFYRYGEFHRLSVVDCIGMGDLLTSSAGAVREHWSRQPESARRPPRVDTFAGGILPYYLPEAYVFETLVSYRAHCATSVGWSRPSPTAAAADYIYAITPGIGTVEEQLPRPRSHYNLVLTRTIASNGAESTLYVFHDPEPLPNPLPRYVDQPCLVTAPAATPQVD